MIDDRFQERVLITILIRLTCDYLISAAYMETNGTVRGAEVENVFTTAFYQLCHVERCHSGIFSNDFVMTS